MAGDQAPAYAPPPLSLPRLTLRFLRFGALAWGGPIAQIAMLRHSLVDRERWIAPDRFNRTLAVYQALPGPEAQELCIFFGMVARGRIGGLLAGLAFLLPGFVLIIGLSWFYVAIGIESPLFAAAFAGCQAAVLALIVRGTHRIGERALRDRWLAVIAAACVVASLAGIHFALLLVTAGLAYFLAARRRDALAALAVGALLAATVVQGVAADWRVSGPGPGSEPAAAATRDAQAPELFASGLQAGALTFGGAYTAIPFVQGDAVRDEGWMSNAQFLDGLALSGILPAPLIIFATFVGFVAGGLAGAVAITAGVFLPAFAITLLGHRHLEAAVANERLHAVLDGVTAGVVGLVAATTLTLGGTVLTNLPAVAIFAACLVTLYVWQAGIGVPVVVIGAGLAGIIAFGT